MLCAGFFQLWKLSKNQPLEKTLWNCCCDKDQPFASAITPKHAARATLSWNEFKAYLCFVCIGRFHKIPVKHVQICGFNVTKRDHFQGTWMDFYKACIICLL